MTTKIKPFIISNCHKRNFRDWVKDQFPELKRHSFSDSPSYQALEERLPEVHQAVSNVFEIINTRSVEVLRKYYAQDEVQLNQAYQKNDVRAYAEALDSFVGAIDAE